MLFATLVARRSEASGKDDEGRPWRGGSSSSSWCLVACLDVDGRSITVANLRWSKV